jgi:hypothetical protein
MCDIVKRKQSFLIATAAEFYSLEQFIGCLLENSPLPFLGHQRLTLSTVFRRVRIFMPLIEELPTATATRVSHGWAYVPDTGPAKSILPPGSRKRGTVRDGATNRGDGSAKQAKIIQARLADLDKENYKDANIPIPYRPKDKGVSRIVTP